eukprot:COSAG01_NODE_1013_length_12138_cov_7.073926_9_plen_130_part_00
MLAGCSACSYRLLCSASLEISAQRVLGGGRCCVRGGGVSSRCACTCLRVRVEIMGSQKCRIVGKSQPLHIIIIDPIIFTRTRRHDDSLILILLLVCDCQRVLGALRAGDEVAIIERCVLIFHDKNWISD